MNRIFAIITLFIISISSYGQEALRRMAVVETSTCYMRLEADYESALETQELMGTVVEIVGESGYWREIVSPQPYKAWTTEKTLVEMSEEQIKAYEAAPKYIFTNLYGHIYTEPSEKAATICDLVGGDVMRVVHKQRANGKASDKEVGKAATKGRWAQVMLPSGKTGWVRKADVRVLGERMNIRMGDSAEGLVSKEQIEAVIAEAEKLLGVPYLWGGMSAKGVDCSGLVRISFIMNDILLPRNASQQIFCGQEIEISPLASLGRNDREDALARTKNLVRGDLVFFGTPATEEKPRRITHVGIYLGNNKIIHSSHLVRINSLIPSDPDYYENSHRLIGACRLSN